MAGRRIREGDWLELELQRVVATWDDGTVTIEFAGQRITLRQDSKQILNVIPGRDRKGLPGED